MYQVMAGASDRCAGKVFLWRWHFSWDLNGNQDLARVKMRKKKSLSREKAKVGWEGPAWPLWGALTVSIQPLGIQKPVIRLVVRIRAKLPTSPKLAEIGSGFYSSWPCLQEELFIWLVRFQDREWSWVVNWVLFPLGPKPYGPTGGLEQNPLEGPLQREWLPQRNPDPGLRLQINKNTDCIVKFPDF